LLASDVKLTHFIYRLLQIYKFDKIRRYFTNSKTPICTSMQVTGIGPKVPVLKLKVGASGYMEGSAVVDDDTDTLNTTTQSNDYSSDVDAGSENQSMTSTMHSRLSSSSELDDQASSEVNCSSDDWSATVCLHRCMLSATSSMLVCFLFPSAV